MSAHEFYEPTDVDTLRMENELLAFENRFLKAKLAEVQRLYDESEISVEHRQARDDLRWLLRRLNQPPVKWLVQRREGFRTLAERHLS